MFRIREQPVGVTVVLGAALLAFPGGLLAQRGAGGVGGGLAGGGGLSGGNGIASGIETSDDLKGFHEVLALQATTQQIGEYGLMLKSTEAGSSQLQAFEKEAAQSSKTELQDHAKILVLAIEQARTANTNFLEGLSDRQKSGLRETIKKLNKTDSELAQQAKTFETEATEAKAATEQMASSAQNLERILTILHDQQIGLGDEMSIGSRANDQEDSFTIPPAKSIVNFAYQPISVTASGMVSKLAVAADQSTFQVEVTADLSDLQQNMTEVLRTRLNKSDPCGEQITIQTAALTPATPASAVVAQLHYERWACFGGRGNANEMAEGNGTLEVTLTPMIAEDGTVRLAPSISRVDAQGLIGDQLRSGSVGETVRDKIADAVLSAVRGGADYKAMLPPSARGNVMLRHAEFEGTGSGQLRIVLLGEIHVAGDKLNSLISELKAGQSKGTPAAQATSR
jgi:hypothetical protein